MKMNAKLRQKSEIALIIDTAAENSIAKLCYFENLQEISFVTIDSKKKLSSTLLNLVNDMLRDNKYNLSDLKIIFVNPGPGSFTGLRIGLTTANLLAFALNIPIVKLNSVKYEKGKFKEALLPEYGRDPNITKPKPRRK